MNKSLIKPLIFAVLLFVLALTLAFSLAFCNKEPEEGSEGESVTDEKPGEIMSSDDFDYKTDISAVKAALNTTDATYLVLANKECIIGEDYQPESLLVIDPDYTLYGKEISLSDNAAKAAVAMIDEMRAEGYNNIYITSGYRSYEYQQNLYRQYFEAERAKNPTLGDEEIKNIVLSYSALPGTSEHQTGLCMDMFVSPGMQELENYGYEGKYPNDIGFAETEEFKWLKENAHKFGFILRYPENKSDITGYSYESWHYRFVGIAAASEIYQRNITFEEYLSK